MKTKPFDFEAAKRGEPVVSLDGRRWFFKEERTQGYKFSTADDYWDFNENGEVVGLEFSQAKDRLFMLDTSEAQEPKAKDELIWIYDNWNNRKVYAAIDYKAAQAFVDYADNTNNEIKGRYSIFSEESVQKSQSGMCGVFVPKLEEYFWIAEQHYDTGLFESLGYKQGSLKSPQNVFRTKEAADNWAFAMNVMLKLRVQPGAEAMRDAKQFCIGFDNNHNPYPDDWRYGFTLRACCFGIFATEQDAKNAINTVGADDITKAARILAGLGNV